MSMLPQDESHNTYQQWKQYEPTQYGETLTIAPINLIGNREATK